MDFLQHLTCYVLVHAPNFNSVVGISKELLKEIDVYFQELLYLPVLLLPSTLNHSAFAKLALVGACLHIFTVVIFCFEQLKHLLEIHHAFDEYRALFSQKIDNSLDELEFEEALEVVDDGIVDVMEDELVELQQLFEEIQLGMLPAYCVHLCLQATTLDQDIKEVEHVGSQDVLRYVDDVLLAVYLEATFIIHQDFEELGAQVFYTQMKCQSLTDELFQSLLVPSVLHDKFVNLLANWRLKPILKAGCLPVVLQYLTEEFILVSRNTIRHRIPSSSSHIEHVE